MFFCGLTSGLKVRGYSLLGALGSIREEIYKAINLSSILLQHAYEELVTTRIR